MNLKGLCPISNNEITNNLSTSLVRFESDFFKGCSLNRTEILNQISPLIFRELIYSRTIKQKQSLIYSNEKSVQYCLDSCLYMHKFIAFNPILKECICLKNIKKTFEISLLNKNDCVLKVDQNTTQIYEIYSTGSIGN